MPYKIVKQGNKYAVVNQDTGKIMGKHPSKSSAKAQLGALYAKGIDSKGIHETDRPMPTSLDIPEEDDELLDRIWDEIGREDKDVAAKEFDESKHPRDHGKFAHSAGSGAVPAKKKPKKTQQAEEDGEKKPKGSDKKRLGAGVEEKLRELSIAPDEVDRLTGVGHLHDLGIHTETVVTAYPNRLSVRVTSPEHPDLLIARTYSIGNAFSEQDVRAAYRRAHPEFNVFRDARQEAKYVEEQRDIFTKSHPPAISHVHNDMFFLPPDAPKGLGTRIFASQVDELSRRGVKSIGTIAGKGKLIRPGGLTQEMNGYYTWPRVGYDAILPSKRVANSPIKPRSDGTYHVADLMKTPEGREWWKKSGFQTEMTFDLTPGSESMRVLARYQAEKATAPATVPSSKNPGRKPRKKQYEIAITTKGDKRYMFLITSNAYEDRENETITSKALHEYVEKVWDANLPPQPLLFWHGGDPIGKIVWVDTEGPFLIEVAEEIPGTFTHKGLNYPVAAIWDYLQKKPEGWGASHGFDYLKSDDRTYERIAKFETSVLPIEKAANPYTFSGVIAMPQRDKVLDEILSVPGAADRLRANVKRLKSVLDQKGIQHKELTATKGLLEELSSQVDEFLGKLSDKPLDDLKTDFIQAIIGALSGAEDAEESPEEQASEDEMTKADDAAGTATTSANPLSNPAKGKQVAYGPTSMAITKEFSDMVTGMVEAQGELADTIARLTKELSDMGELRSEVKALKDRMRLAPRIASRASETVVDDAVAKKAMAEDGYVVDPVFGKLKQTEE